MRLRNAYIGATEIVLLCPNVDDFTIDFATNHSDASLLQIRDLSDRGSRRSDNQHDGMCEDDNDLRLHRSHRCFFVKSIYRSVSSEHQRLQRQENRLHTKNQRVNKGHRIDHVEIDKLQRAYILRLQQFMVV